MSVRIAQLSDLHLFRERDGCLAGVPTWDTFRAVLDLATRDANEVDYLVLSGDLAQDETLDTYLMLRDALGDWLPRCRLIPGNHDDRGHLRTAFPELPPGGDGVLTFTSNPGGWRVIGLDSQIPGEIRGRIDTAQLAWLEDELLRAPNTPTLLFVHHPPMALDFAWVDALDFEDPAGLIGLIERSPQVKAVSAGHVHQSFAGRIAGAAMYTTPSTCVQFGSRVEQSFDTAAAGYRLFTLREDGTHHTAVHRLPYTSRPNRSSTVETR